MNPDRLHCLPSVTALRRWKLEAGPAKATLQATKGIAVSSRTSQLASQASSNTLWIIMLNSLTMRAQHGTSFACGLRLPATSKAADPRQDRPLQT